MIDENKWSLDKKISLPLIAALVLQTCALVAWGAKTEERILSLERVSAASDGWDRRLTRIEVLVEQINNRPDREDRRR